MFAGKKVQPDRSKENTLTSFKQEQKRDVLKSLKNEIKNFNKDRNYKAIEQIDYKNFTVKRL